MQPGRPSQCSPDSRTPLRIPARRHNRDRRRRRRSELPTRAAVERGVAAARCGEARAMVLGLRAVRDDVGDLDVRPRHAGENSAGLVAEALGDERSPTAGRERGSHRAGRPLGGVAVREERARGVVCDPASAAVVRAGRQRKPRRDAVVPQQKLGGDGARVGPEPFVQARQRIGRRIRQRAFVARRTADDGEPRRREAWTDGRGAMPRANGRTLAIRTAYVRLRRASMPI